MASFQIELSEPSLPLRRLPDELTIAKRVVDMKLLQDPVATKLQFAYKMLSVFLAEVYLIKPSSRRGILLIQQPIFFLCIVNPCHQNS